MNESISDYANMFAQHQNSNLSEKSIIDKEFDNNKQSHCANMPNTNIMNNNNNAKNKKKDEDHSSNDYPETKKHEYFFDKLDNILESLNTEWLYSSDSESHTSEESVGVNQSFEIDSIRIINHLK